MRTETEWAQFLASKLTTEELTEFAEFLDGCDSVEFYFQVGALDRVNHPEKYCNCEDAHMIKKEVEDVG